MYFTLNLLSVSFVDILARLRSLFNFIFIKLAKYPVVFCKNKVIIVLLYRFEEGAWFTAGRFIFASFQ